MNINFTVKNALLSAFITMFVLKVTGFLTISWWWITAPIWGPWAIAGVVSIVTVGYLTFRYGTENGEKRLKTWITDHEKSES